VDAAVAAPEPVATEGSDLRALLCGTREPCRLVKETPVDSRILETVALAPPGAEDAGDESDMTPCISVESWLVTKKDARFVREQLLVTDCVRLERGWPAEIKVKGDVVRYELDGQDVPSTWVGWRWAEVGLDPPRLIADGASYWNRMQRCPREEVERRTSLDALGRPSAAGLVQNVTWSSATRCDDDPSTCTRPGALAFLAVPRLKLPPEYERDGWRSTEIGSCSVTVDGAPGRGFVTFGASSGASDASMRVVLSDAHVLYVDVRDDRFTSGAQWVKSDHLEIWSTPSGPSYMTACPPSSDKPTQWGITIADAKVHRGVVGTVDSLLTADRAEANGVVHLRVALPKTTSPLEGLTVAYSDSDDGARQKSLVATSKLVFGRQETLGRVERLPTTSCVVRSGRLDVESPLRSPTTRLYPTDPD
jgi:hypothetical protein